MNKQESPEINHLIDKFADVFDSFNQVLDNHEKMARDLLQESSYKDLYQLNLMLSELHVIDCIGKNKLPNATFVAKEMNMTRGAISKITSKLLDKDLIKGSQLENNKKEVFYTLTAKGKEVYKIHEKLHDAEHEKFVNMFSKYNKDELSIISRFLDDVFHQI